MKVSFKKTAVFAVLAVTLAGGAIASVGGTGILGTRHDFATRTNFLGSQSVGTAGAVNQVGVCSFCHTPHSAISTALLWNKSMSANTFKWDDTTTTGGTSYAEMAPTYKGATVKCLACHDGSVAVGDVNMYRGKKGTYNSFKVGDQPSDYTGKTWGSSDARPQYRVGVSGSMSGTHPVGMPYPYEQKVNTYNGVQTGPSVVLSEFQPNPHQISNTTAGSPTAGPMIKLYNDVGGSMVSGPSATTTGMECSTCHDPHNKQTNEDWMLRAKNSGSTYADGYICLQCHIK